MHRFYAETVSHDRLTISGDEAKHIKNALRLKPGDNIIAFDGTGMDYICDILQIGASVDAAIIERIKNTSEAGISVTLYQAYPKAAKMEEIVQKAVELGVSAIVPFLSIRCVKRPDDVSRLRRVALSAVKQCGRSLLPKVEDVTSFENALELMQKHERLIVCWEEETQVKLKNALSTHARDIGIVVGSEGGFEETEVRRMRDAGGVSVTLGQRILRTETAGIAVLAAVMYEKGQM